uniref:RHS repeat-associated core domain-containing protein n=1 Tax=Clostridium sp. UBA5119 TaxID=1946366 RepID=UPI003216F540
QSRYYNPEWGRFLNGDAIGGNVGALLSHNIFAYCNNNPVISKDPNGFRPMYTQGEETDAMREASLQVMNAVSKKEPPPSEVGYKTPKGKGKTETVKLPNGQRGWGDADGNVWVPIP